MTSLTAAALFNQVLGIQPHSLAGSLNENTFSPLVNLQYRFDPDAMAYASFSRGHKSGGFDARSKRPPAATPPANPLVPNGGSFQYKGERATTYEMGVKAGLGSTAEINADVFYTDYDDLQTTAFDGAIGFNVGNGTARVQGAELEGRWRVSRGLRLSGSLAYLDFEWKNYLGQAYYDNLLALGLPNTQYAGHTNQLAPKFTGFLSAGIQLATGRRHDPHHHRRCGAFQQVSAVTEPGSAGRAAGLQQAQCAPGAERCGWWMELALVGRNLTDKTTVSFAGDTPLAFRLFRARSYYGFVDAPRSIAIEARLKF